MSNARVGLQDVGRLCVFDYPKSTTGRMVPRMGRIEDVSPYFLTIKFSDYESRIEESEYKRFSHEKIENLRYYS